MNNFTFEKSTNDTLLEIAKKMIHLRKQAGYSQVNFAKRSGVSHGSLKRFENSGQISFEALLKLTNVLDRLSDFDEMLKPKDDLKRIEKLFSLEN